MKVTVAGHSFEIKEIKKQLASDRYQIEYCATHKGHEYKLGLVYDTIFEDDDFIDNIEDIISEEIRLELFGIIHGVDVPDICAGKYPNLVEPFIKEFGVLYLDIETAEKYQDLVDKTIVSNNIV